jgi:regulator of sigma E protease
MEAFLDNLWWQWLWPVVQLLVGLGLVVFVHELGHFLVAKRVGIAVDKFAVGFGPRLFGVRRGETDYCVNLLPLGGYVKMLGQEDFKPVEDQLADPRAFNNKPVGARVAVTSAGVVMNCLFAAGLFIIVSLVGMRFPAPVVGGVLPGRPAAMAQITWQGEAPPSTSARPPAPAPAQAATQPAIASAGKGHSKGLEAGDRIVRIEGPNALLAVTGKQVERFTTLQLIAALSDPDDCYDVTFERTVDGRAYRGIARLGVKRQMSENGTKRFNFGIFPARSLKIAPVDKYRGPSVLQTGDLIVAVNGQEARDYAQFISLVQKASCDTVELTVLRNSRPQQVTLPQVVIGGPEQSLIFVKGKVPRRGRIVGDKTDGQVVYQDAHGQEHSLDGREVVSIVPAYELSLLGMAPRVMIAAVEKGSPAHEARLEAGDVILDYGDRGAPTLGGLHQVNYEAAGEGTHIVVLHDGQVVGPLWIVPKRHQGQVMMGIMPTVDLEHTVIAEVNENSPAQRAGLAPGQQVEAVNGQPVQSWPQMFRLIKSLYDQGGRAVLTVREGQEVRQVDLGPVSADVFDPRQYECEPLLGAYGFEPLMGPLHRQTNPALAVAWGARETVYFLATSYATLTSWIKGYVESKDFIGPVGIGHLAIQAGRRSLIDLVYFMAMISVSLAVVNFLPIPVVDGGIVTLLLIEKLRGRPLPLKVQNVIQMAGLVLIVCVFLAVTWQDVTRMLGW